MPEVEHALIVGCGSIGGRHAKNLRSLGVKVRGYDTDSNRRESFAAELDAPVSQDMETALATGPDLTVIAVPNDAHIDVATEAAQVGSHLFIEKPLSRSEDGIESLVKLADRRDLTTMVGCNLRFHPCLRRLKSLVQNKAIGSNVTVGLEAGSYLPDWHPDEDYRDMYSAKTETGGGVLLDFIHEVNYARWMFGEVDKVTALTRPGTTLDIETEEAATISLKFRSGMVGQILLNYVQRPYHRSCQLIGSKGTLTWDWNDEIVRRYSPDRGEWVIEHTLVDWDPNEMYVDELKHFLTAIREGGRTICPLRSGWRDLRVALGAKSAAKEETHQTVDPLPC